MDNTTNINEMIAELLRGHGLSVSYYKEWLVCNGTLPGIYGHIVQETQHKDSLTVQLDVQVAVDSDTVIFECFAGIGGDRNKAVQDAIGNFALNSLHPLLSAFYGLSSDQVTTETWEFGGAIWKATIGNWGLKHWAEPTPSVPEEVFPTIERLIKSQVLINRIHWLRLYYAHMDGQTLSTEVLLDNEPWEAAQDQVAKLDWPISDRFYSARLFLILQRTDS
jgi:hypothetical protein